MENNTEQRENCPSLDFYTTFMCEDPSFDPAYILKNARIVKEELIVTFNYPTLGHFMRWRYRVAHWLVYWAAMLSGTDLGVESELTHEGYKITTVENLPLSLEDDDD